MPKLMYDDKNYSGNASSSGGGMFPHLIVISETGSTVTATKGSTTITARETSTDHFECDLVTPNPQDTYGTWVIHAILNGDDAQANLVVDAVKVYTVDDEHFHADIIVTYPDGAVVSCTKDGLSPMYATSSPYTFTVHSIGMYTIAGERDGIIETIEADITTNGQTINITLDLLPDGETVTPTDDVQTLLLCAGIDDKPYTTISALIADDTTLLKVITHNNAIDYLVRSTTFASAITADEDAMAMIGSYDYCADTLLADSTWATAIISSTYASSVINISTPTMTSNTTPSGECGGNGYYNNYWYAFNKSLSDFWSTNTTGASPNARIFYKFAEAVKCIAVKFAPRQDALTTGRPINYTIETSDDGSTWDSPLLAITGESAISAGEYIVHTFSNSNAKQYYSIYCTVSGIERLGLAELDFLGREIGGVQTWLRAGGITDKSYTTLAEVLADTTTLSTLIASHNAVDYLVTAKGFIDGIVADATAMSYIGLNNYCANTLLADAEWCKAIGQSAYKESVLNVKVPTMTSNTTPSGVASASTEHQPAYIAFDGNTSNGWQSVSVANHSGDYVTYKFAQSVCVKYVEVYIGLHNAAGTNITVKVRASNDNTTWTDLTDSFTTNLNTLKTVGLNNTNSYLYYQIYIVGGGITNSRARCTLLQFYGREDV